jgi:hypothetical protein
VHERARRVLHFEIGVGERGKDERVANLQDLLKGMVDRGASDLHITTGIPPHDSFRRPPHPVGHLSVKPR